MRSFYHTQSIIIMIESSFQKRSVSAEAARAMLVAAEAKAREIGVSISIHIVDESGVMKAFSRMDYAPLVTVDAARKKAIINAVIL